ncbi:MAG: dynamin family protein [Prevotella sp.]|nr:dynamin family protein [Bacteroidales bacterium]MDY4955944.1 dynamin family protein [Prevotella sp.]
MNKTNIYVNALNNAFGIAKAQLDADAARKDEEEKDRVVEELNKEAYIKVPFVGDFSSGKSTLLNAMMGVDLLPTNILPQTAVSYELYYSEQERLDIFEEDKLIGTEPLSKIKELKLSPKNHVVVYINNDFVKHYNDRHIILVDMPGIDSGIEAHNNAILQYIQQGNCFILVTEAAQGTLRGSTLSFVDEVRKYDTSLYIVVSKTDKKPKDSLDGIRQNIGDIANRLTGENIPVVFSSAADNDCQQVVDMLDSIDAEQVIRQKYGSIVSSIINGYISELQVQVNFLSSNKNDFTQQIEKLREEKERALKSLESKKSEAQPLHGSAEDILQDISDALIAKAGYLATLLYQRVDNDSFNRELMTIIRPVIVNSFKREVTEYQDVIGSALQEFVVNVDNIINDKGNKVLDGAQEIAGNLMGKDLLEGLLQKGFDKLAAALVGYKGLSTLVKALSKILGPLVVILVNALPDLIRIIFGKSKETKINEIKEKFISMAIGQITDSLREPVENMLQEQRDKVDNSVAELVKTETQKYDDSIQSVLRQKQESEQNTAERIQQLQAATSELRQVAEQM